MEKKVERKWKTLRTLASQVATPEEEDVFVPSLEENSGEFVQEEKAAVDPYHTELDQEEPLDEGTVGENPVSEAPVDRPLEDTSRIRISVAPKIDTAEPGTSIVEEQESIGPEAHSPVDHTLEDEALDVAISEIDEAVYKELEKLGPVFAPVISAEIEPLSEQEPKPMLELNDEALDPGNRILVAHGVTSTSRLIRETLENFTGAEVETTSDPVRAFELALQKPFRRFFFAMQVGELSGAMLYELISKAYENGSATRTLAPGVVFIREKSDPQLPPELVRDARVKGTLSKPVRIERLLKSVEDIFEVRDPTVKES